MPRVCDVDIETMVTPFDAFKSELAGWTLFWADIEVVHSDGKGGAAEADAVAERVAAARERWAGRARARFDRDTLSSHPTVSALRGLFRRAGTDPTKYRPSSEALLRRVLKGDDLPAISSLVDINNCLSIELAVPCCVMAAGTFEGPIVLRAGKENESYASLRGPFRLAGRPALCNATGPLDTPITGNERVKVTGKTRRAWLVAYLPSGVVAPESAATALDELIGATGAATIHASGVC